MVIRSNWKPKLLCIDDEPEVLAIFQEFLESAGYVVTAVNNGAEGLRLLRDRSFDAVVVDYDMEEMDGGEVARQIKAASPHMPVVMFSGYASDIPKSVVRLVDESVAKGTEAQAVLGALSRVLARADEEENGTRRKPAASSAREKLRLKARRSK